MKKSFTTVWTSLLLAGLSSLIVSCSSRSEGVKSSGKDAMLYNRTEIITQPDSALQLLKTGNHRFASDSVLADDEGVSKRSLLKEKGQKPFAVIVTCSDSRVPPELIFDQGLGDLFVIRVAGNVIDSVCMGSIEYAVEHLKAPLVIVMGHEKCGAVKATVEGGEAPGSIPSICKRILPSLKLVKSITSDEKSIAEMVAVENVKAGVKTISDDKLLKEAIEKGKLKVLGAKYYLESGRVDFIQ